MIVAIDGASTDLSLALVTPAGDPVADVAWTSAQRQSAEVLPRLLELMDGAGRRFDAVTALAVGTGPGSFTGLRVAMALAKGLAAALDRPIVGVPSLVAWLGAEPDAHAALARTGAREAYLLARGQDGVRIVDRDALPSLLGSGPIVAPRELADAFGLAGARSPRAATTIARMAAGRLAASPAGDDRDRLEPIYLRAPRGLPGATDPASVRVSWR